MSSTLICYDGSSSAERALALTQRVLDRRPKVLLTVWSPPEPVHGASFGFDQDDGPGFARLSRLLEHAARETAEDGQRVAGALGIEAETRVQRAHRSVWETILAVADELDSGLIVIGTRGTTAVQSDLLGSVSAALVHHSHRPVLVVPDAERPVYPAVIASAAPGVGA